MEISALRRSRAGIQRQLALRDRDYVILVSLDEIGEFHDLIDDHVAGAAQLSAMAIHRFNSGSENLSLGTCGARRAIAAKFAWRFTWREGGLRAMFGRIGSRDAF